MSNTTINVNSLSAEDAVAALGRVVSAFPQVTLPDAAECGSQIVADKVQAFIDYITIHRELLWVQGQDLSNDLNGIVGAFDQEDATLASLAEQWPEG